MAVSGSAAASAKSRLAGLRPTMRSSTRWNSALVPGRVEGARVEDRIARANRVASGPDADHGAGRVPAEHLRLRLGCVRRAHLGVDRVHRDGLDFTSRSRPGGLGFREVEVDSGLASDGQAAAVADGTHGELREEGKRFVRPGYSGVHLHAGARTHVHGP